MLWGDLVPGLIYQVVKGNDTLYAGDHIRKETDGSLSCQATFEKWHQKNGFFTPDDDIETITRGVEFAQETAPEPN